MKKNLSFLIILISSLKFSFSQNDNAGKIFTMVEQMPQFPGGEAAMFKYLASNIHYPPLARENGIGGKVFITFVVDTNGSLKDPKVLRGIGGGCDEEALRVVSSMPQWEPGKQNGNKANVQYNLPIMFKLSGIPARINSKSFYETGVDQFSLGEYETAIKSFTKAIEENQKNIDAYYNRAASYKKLGNDSAACLDWQKAKNLGDKQSEKLLAKYCGIKKDSTAIVEVMPEFPGAEAGLLRYLQSNLKYPKEAKQNHVEGIVKVCFIIDKNGKVKDAKVLKGLGFGCDEEALRLVNTMSDWKPGTQNGNPVSVQYNLPIKF